MSGLWDIICAAAKRFDARPLYRASWETRAERAELTSKYPHERPCPNCGSPSELLGSTSGTYDYHRCRWCEYKFEVGQP